MCQRALRLDLHVYFVCTETADNELFFFLFFGENPVESDNDAILALQALGIK